MSVLANMMYFSELEKELESANLKMQRLKEVYRKTSQEFCDVSYMLLGYRIVLVSNNKLYKLYNVYSSSPSDYLMFQVRSFKLCILNVHIPRCVFLSCVFVLILVNEKRHHGIVRYSFR